MSVARIIRLTDDSADIGGGLPAPVQSEALFSDDFESYTVGSTINGEGDGSFQWTAGNGDTSSLVVSNDIARVGTRSLRFRFGPGASSGWTEQRFAIGANLTELWVEYYLYYPDGTEGFGSASWNHRYSGSSHGAKLFTLFSNTYSDSDNAQLIQGSYPIDNYQTGTSGDSWLIQVGARDYHNPSVLDSNMGNTTVVPYVCDAGPCPRGQWVRHRYHVRLSDRDADNGVYQMWVGDTLVIDDTGLPIGAGSALQHYFNNGYIFGANNDGFASLTYAYLDGWAVYSSDPGW